MKLYSVLIVIFLLPVYSSAQQVERQPHLLLPYYPPKITLEYFKHNLFPYKSPFPKDYQAWNLPNSLIINKALSAKKKFKFKLNKEMPVMQPDSNTKQHILAIKPDSTIHYHLWVKKIK